MDQKSQSQYNWLAELVLAVLAFLLAAGVWVLSTCAYRVLFRRYAEFGRRPPLVGLAVGMGAATAITAVLALAGLSTAAVVVGLGSLGVWIGAVALLGLHYDQQERQTLQQHANQTLTDILSGDSWWSERG